MFKALETSYVCRNSVSVLFRKFMGNESNCSANQMARKPMNVKINNYNGIKHVSSKLLCRTNDMKLLTKIGCPNLK